MELLIKDFAKIKYAKIKCNGITVIAGENNTGKSTIGKVLFSIYNSTTNLKEKINDQRMNEISDNLELNLRNLIVHNQTLNNISIRGIRQISSKIIEDIFKDSRNISIKQISRTIEKNFQFYKIASDNYNKSELLPILSEKIDNIISLPDERITLEVISRYFTRVFYQQLNNVLDDTTKAEIELKIKGSKMNLAFEGNVCTNFSTEFNIIHNAFYIDNPFIVDELSSFYMSNNILEKYTIKALSKNEKDIMEGIFDTITAKEKLREIYRILENVIDGDISENQSGEYYFNSNKLEKPILVNNLSTGLKAFVIVKMLLEKGSLKERDVLILDEPEIHLHPEWQLYYAEIVVLLEKYFNLTIIITTHSPYFLESIEVFAAKHKTSNKVNYYLAETNDEFVSNVKEVTDNIEAIFKKLADPMQQLENIRNSIDNDI